MQLTEEQQVIYRAQSAMHYLQNSETYYAHAKAESLGCLCHACPLYGCRRGPVFGDLHLGAVGGTEIPATAKFKLIVVGESPGTMEVEQGQTLVGPGGALMTEALAAGGAPRLHENVGSLVTNVLMCRPERDDLKKLVRKTAKRIKQLKKDGSSELLLHAHQACQPHVAREIEDARSRGVKVVLGLGGVGLASVAAHFGVPYGPQRAAPGQQRLAVVGKQHGAPLRLEPYDVTICASIHPAGVMKEKRYQQVVKDDIRRAAVLATRDGRIEWHEPEYIVLPTADVCLNVIDKLRVASLLHSTHVVLDIETDSKYAHLAKLRCIGLAGTVDGKELVISVPLNHMDGRPWWPPAIEQQIVNAIRRLFTECRLAGHNVIGYDSQVLLRFGIWPSREKKALDTMLLHHDSPASELKHDLGFVAARTFIAPAWKQDADSKVVDNVDMRTLALYNCKDCLGTLRLIRPLFEETLRSGMLKPFEIDSELALIARDMGDLGLVYDMEVRLAHFDKQTTRARKLAKEIAEVVGKEGFNSNSVPQLKTWLFEDLQLTPPVNREGKPWSELENDLDDATVDESALQALLNNGVPPRVEQALNLILEERGVRKLLGTYIQLEEAADQAAAKKLEREGRVVHRLGARFLAEGVTSLVRLEDWGPFGTLPILHPSYKIHVVPSGRFAATPNVLAWPKEMRGMVIAPPGHKLVGGDAEQIEARLFGLNSDDPKIMAAFLKDIDLHTYNWATMNCATEAEAERYYQEMMAKGGKKDPKIDHCRTIAKVFMYSLTYGSEIDTLYQNMVTKRRPDGKLAFPGLTKKDVRKWYDAWHRLHPQTKQYFARLEREHRQRGYVESLVYSRKLFMAGGWDRNVAANFPQQCLQYCTRVLTTRGWEQIGELHDRGEPLVAYTGTRFAPARVLPKPNAEIVKLHLSNGMVVECDVHHKVKVPGVTEWEWRTAADLPEGTTLAMQLAKSLEFGAKLDPEKAYWAGYHCGNGSWSRENATCVRLVIGERAHLPRKMQVARLEQFLTAQVGRFNVAHMNQGLAVVEAQATYSTVNMSGNGFAAVLAECGFKPGLTAHTKRIPARIMGADLEARRAFLRGMFDADGCLNERKRENGAAFFRLCNEELTRDLWLLGLTVGLDGSLAGPYRADKAGHVAYVLTWNRAQLKAHLGTGAGGKIRTNQLAPNFEARRLLKLPLSDKGCASRASAVVLRSRIRKGGSVSVYQLAAMGVEDTFSVVQLVRVERTGRVEPTFTLEVDAPEHSYSAEGVISKNSSSADLMNDALIEVARAVGHRKWSQLSGTILQVHDAIVLQVPDSRAEEAQKMLKKAMTKSIGVMPFPAAVKKPGNRWSEV